VEVSRKEYLNLTIAVDDEDPRFSQLFDKHDGRLLVRGNWRSLMPVIEEITKDKYDNEWETDAENMEVEGLKIEPKEEALKYKTFDAMTKKWLN
jgi:hypothetical protein